MRSANLSNIILICSAFLFEWCGLSYEVDGNVTNSSTSPTLTLRASPTENTTDQHGRLQLAVAAAVPEKFQSVFPYSHFNAMQSVVLNDMLNSDRNIVISAPTGAGKTVALDLALIRMLSKPNHGKAVYIAPIKALCAERALDWKERFGSLGINVQQWTGDIGNDIDALNEHDIRNADLVLTTPEKWHSTTKSWRNTRESAVAKSCTLILLDEAHFLNESPRGATLEAAVSRMQTIHEGEVSRGQQLRFVAISATIPNIVDLAAWLGAGAALPTIQHQFGDEFRPVKLEIQVEAYPSGQNGFAFDKVLDSKVSDVLFRHNPQFKATLLFSHTRGGCTSTAEAILRSPSGPKLITSMKHRQQLASIASQISEKKVGELLRQGIGVHHAGLLPDTLRIVAEAFKSGRLLMVCATSTLAQGVNLPAYMVIIKNTQHWQGAAGLVEYSEHNVLQMMGRAGRPQYETHGKAVIMTRSTQRQHYLDLSTGSQLIESNLKDNMLGHMNAEIALGTITDIPTALSWLKYSFFWVRVQQRPEYYGISVEASEEPDLDIKIQELALKDIQQLVEASAVTMNEDMVLAPTYAGKQMAKWSIALDTLKVIKDSCLGCSKSPSLGDMLLQLAHSKEFGDITLRNNEKTPLKRLNKPAKKEGQDPIRFPIKGTGTIKTVPEKVSVLVQATLSNFAIAPEGPGQLVRDVDVIFLAGRRISNLLLDLISHRDTKPADSATFEQAARLVQAFRTRLWYDSKFVSKQIGGVGIKHASALVKAQLTSYQRLANSSSAAIEMACNQRAPFGSTVLKKLKAWPVLDVAVTPTTKDSSVDIDIDIIARDTSSILESKHHVCCWLLFARTGNKILYVNRFYLWQLRKEGGAVRRSITLPADHSAIELHLITTDYAGIDWHHTLPDASAGERYNLRIDDLLGDSDDDPIFPIQSNGTPRSPSRKRPTSDVSAPRPKKTRSINTKRPTGTKKARPNGTLEKFVEQANFGLREMAGPRVSTPKRHVVQQSRENKVPTITTVQPIPQKHNQAVTGGDERRNPFRDSNQRGTSSANGESTTTRKSSKSTPSRSSHDGTSVAGQMKKQSAISGYLSGLNSMLQPSAGSAQGRTGDSQASVPRVALQSFAYQNPKVAAVARALMGAFILFW